MIKFLSCALAPAFVFLLFASAFIPCRAVAGQNITIGGPVGHDVFGNGDVADNGKAPISNDPASLINSPDNNTVTIISSGDVIGAVIGGSAENASGTPTASGNKVISSGNVPYSISGGDAYGDSGTATATGNSVTISDGTVGVVSGGFASSYSGTATATGNSVTLSGGTVGNDIHGGYAYSDTGYATATGNSVIISGGTVEGDVFGGVSYVDQSVASGSATGNTVTISGTPTFTSGNLFGGIVAGAGTALDEFSGNTLNVWNYNGSSIVGVYNFEYYNFVFPASQSGPVLTVIDEAYLGDGTRGSTVTASILGGSSPLQAGDSVTLIGGYISTNGFSQTTAQGSHGATLLYNWSLDTSTGTALTVTLDSVDLNPRTKALSEGWISGMALVNQGADAAAGQGIDSAVKAAQGNTLAGFGSFSGGWSRYDTGSHVDVSSLSLLTGLSFGLDLTPGRLTLGAFFEYGNGSYDTHNSFSTAASVKGDGDMYYIGGGILGRMDFTNTGPGRFYAEATGRAGKVHNEYKEALNNSFSRCCLLS